MRQQPRTVILAATMAVASFGLLAAGARADVIDGDWCNGVLHFIIEGSSIVTPGRNKIQGRYGRYNFAYVVPANEPGAGGEVTMVMVRGQEIVQLKRPGQSGDPEVWRRCKPIS